MAESESAGNLAAAEVWLEALRHVDEAVIVLDAKETVTFANGAATDLISGLAVGLSMNDTDAFPAPMLGNMPSFEADSGGRRVEGRRIDIAGHRVWYLRECFPRTSASADERTELLGDVHRRLAWSANRGKAARLAAQCAVPWLGDMATVALIEPGGVLAWYRDSDAEGSRASGRTAASDFGWLLPHGGGPSTVEDDPRLADQLNALGWVIPAEFGAVGPAVASPLPGFGEVIGFLIVGRRTGGAPYEAADRQLILQYASHAGYSIAAASTHQDHAAAAEALRAGMRPGELPAVDGMLISAIVRPGTVRPATARPPLGAIFYDVIATGRASRPGVHGDAGHRTWAFVFGGVCGSGVDGAVQAVAVRHALMSLRLLVTDPSRLLARMNDVLFSMPTTPLTSVVVGNLTIAPSGTVAVTLGVSGHLSPIIIRVDGPSTVVDLSNVPLGAYPLARFRSMDLVLEPGDTLLLGSAGVTCARGGPSGAEAFGLDRLVAETTRYHGVPAAALAERIELVTSTWLAGNESDDIAILVLQARPKRRQHRSGSAKGGAGEDA